MSNMISIGRRLVPSGHIVFVEPFDPAANPDFQSSRKFSARVTMLDRDSLLSEEPMDGFVSEHGFRLLEADRVAMNPLVHFRVERFEATDGFATTKAYATRVLWKDLDGRDQSKLLITDPETVLAIVVSGEPPASEKTVAAGAPRTRRQKSNAAAPQV